MRFGKLSRGGVLVTILSGALGTVCLGGSPSFTGIAATQGPAPAPFTDSSGGCLPPHYQLVKTDWDVNDSDGIAMSVVIALRDFAPEHLLCLVDTLAARYKRPRFVAIDIFSSARAARTCLPDISMTPHCPQRHAKYQFDARTNQQFIEILPMGSPTWGGEDTLVYLPAVTLRPCRLEIAHRCFLEIYGPDYPDETLAAPISATIVVAGKIDRGGRAANVEISATNAENARGEKASADPLVQMVMRNVRTWRLEESAQETPFNIAFEFSVTDELSDLSLEFQLPRRVIVRGKPSLLKYK